MKCTPATQQYSHQGLVAVLQGSDRQGRKWQYPLCFNLHEVHDVLVARDVHQDAPSPPHVCRIVCDYAANFLSSNLVNAGL